MKALIGQLGPRPYRTDDGIEALARWLDEQLATQPADFVAVSELATTPFFSVTQDRTWLHAGTDPQSEAFAPLSEVVRARRTHLALAFAERRVEAGELFNSSVLIGPDGKLVRGRYCSGPSRGQPTYAYRKIHLSENRNATPGVHEKYFFRPGDGFVVYDTDFGRVAPLICYDRSFPEAWRTVRLAGARIVTVPAAFSRAERAKMFQQELCVAAAQNGVFVLAASKGGTESYDGTADVTYHGASVAISPLGDIIAEGPTRTGPIAVYAELDLALLDTYDMTYHVMRDRRPDTYRATEATDSVISGEKRETYG